MRALLSFTIAAATLITACGDDSAPLFKLYEPEPETPERLAWDADIVRYLGVRPSETRDRGEGEVTYTFDQADGPQCLRGLPYRASIRDTGSEDLLVFLQGGGACWSDFCFAITSAPAGIAGGNLLDRDHATNPYADYNVAYLPYCDGSLFSGDRDAPEDDPEKLAKGFDTRHYRGLANLSAGLTMAHHHFPSPRKVVLAGSSGGGYGTILASFLVRYVFPDADIEVVNDSGVGIAKEGDVEFIEKLISEFGAEDFMPPDCDGCTADGHIVGLVEYLLERDPNLRVAAITSWYDFVISELFLGIDATLFQDSIETHTGALHEKFPDRYRRFIYDGAGHTATLGNVTGIIGSDLINGVELPSDFGADTLGGLELLSIDSAAVGEVTLAEWLAAMTGDDDEAWADLTAEPTPPE